MAVTIEIAESVTSELVEAFVRLIPQLSSSSPPPSGETLQAIIDSPAADLLVARVDGKIVGSLTLVLFQIPTTVRAIIEDVVVDGAARGHGVGEALSRFAIQRAQDRGVTKVDLTSRPSREAANRLYQRMGFVQRMTNVYRYTIEGTT